MVKRRSLVERVATAEGVDPALAEDFIYGRTPGAGGESRVLEAGVHPAEDRTAPEAKEIELPVKEITLPEGKMQAGATLAKAPLTTRIRADLAAALKRASLERQLQGKFPQKVHAILEDALEPWLRSHGYLP